MVWASGALDTNSTWYCPPGVPGSPSHHSEPAVMIGGSSTSPFAGIGREEQRKLSAAADAGDPAR